MEINYCENCGKEIEINKRFCSTTCSHSFSSSKQKHKEWKCSCGEVLSSRRKLQNHRKICSIAINNPQKKVYGILNCPFCGKQKETTIEAIKMHINHCYSNPNRKEFFWENRKLSDEQKQKISESMKKAHAEGRAHNIGECRWNNEPSYSEQWFMKVLKNEFGFEKDKDYKMELPFHRFSLDFAWPDKKVCIEIDGEQHERFQEQKLRDIEKDKLLKKEGWEELRKSWQDIFNNPKSFIEEVKILLDRC